MRIIGGIFGGQTLKTHNTEHEGFRPTSDKVRGAIFNMIQFEIEGKSVCDLFAGTGALGIEALSRGAKFCSFVEANSKTAALIKTNLEKLKISNNEYELFLGPVERYIKHSRMKFDFIFMDPPYNKQFVTSTIENLQSSPLLTAGTQLIIEHHVKEPVILPISSNYKTLKEKNYGEKSVTILLYETQKQTGA